MRDFSFIGGDGFNVLGCFHSLELARSTFLSSLYNPDTVLACVFVDSNRLIGVFV
jgi:hypothetical protein